MSTVTVVPLDSVNVKLSDPTVATVPDSDPPARPPAAGPPPAPGPPPGAEPPDVLAAGRPPVRDDAPDDDALDDDPPDDDTPVADDAPDDDPPDASDTPDPASPASLAAELETESPSRAADSAACTPGWVMAASTAAIPTPPSAAAPSTAAEIRQTRAGCLSS